ncbi:sulfurtransferase [Piscinibacter sp.]|uniref:sulfurtransferase n=1 Tax=Piscinibacter sp. TaxID=1903157 RepID=UPI002CB0055D|nr:sulfurtransferase [Albitalea sp.]HUG22663.1 sulfurtransferase [Albitalea sp.]
MKHNALIDAEQLRRLAADAPLVVIDTSFDLADTAAGERSYREGHLPGAHFLHLETDLSGPKTGRNGRHPLPSREAFAATVGALDVTPETQVVVYDRQQAMFAARAWWMLRWLGHAAVAVLDGGLQAWQAAGGALETAVPPRLDPAAPYPTQPSLVAVIDSATLAAQLGRVRLIDARAPERFRGEVEPLDAQAGHIPGALNRFFRDNLAPDGRFKPPSELRAAFESLAANSDRRAVIHQCGSGATACHNLLAMEVAGLDGSVLYPGSWSEWSADPSRPIAQG